MSAVKAVPMVDADQYDNVDFEEELAHEKEANEEERVEYERMLELARRTNQTGTSEIIKDIIDATEDPVDDSDDNVTAIIEYVINHHTQWGTGGSEFLEFRSLVRESFEEEWGDFSTRHPVMTVGEAMQKLPPVYYASPLPPAQLDALTRNNQSASRPGIGVVKTKVHYHDNFGSPCSMVREVTFTQSAKTAISDVVTRIHTVLNIDGVLPDEYMFKVVGRADFIYGDESFINFRYIRDCVVKLLEVKLYVMRLPFESSVLSAPRFSPSYQFHNRRMNQSHEELSVANLCCRVPTKASTTATAATATAADGSGSGSKSGAAAVRRNRNVSLWDVRQQFQVRLDELSNLQLSAERCANENLRDGDDLYVCVVAELVFGGVAVCPPERTPWRCCKGMIGSTGNSRVLWGPSGKLTFDVSTSDLPRELRLCLSVVAVAGDNQHQVASASATQLLDDSLKGQEKKMRNFVNMIQALNVFDHSEEQTVCPLFYLASVNTQVFDHTATLKTGMNNLRMWATDQRANLIACGSSNPDYTAVGCRLDFPTFALPVVLPSGAPPSEKEHELEIAQHDKMMAMELSLRDNKIAQLRQIKRVLATDPLYSLSESDKVLLYQYRHELMKRPKALCKFLLAVDWMRPAAVHEAHDLIERWAPLQPMDALELLDARYADISVREHAIRNLDKMADNELKNCALQLVQVLKYEPYHLSPLAMFLLKRSLASPHFIGHCVFWHLKAEMFNPAVSERHGLILHEYLGRLPSRRDVLRQHYVTEQLLGAALRIKESKKSERLSDLREQLDKLHFPPSFTLPLNPTMECCGLHISKCKVMDSKKLPLWLVFTNTDPLGGSIYIIFKAGDDLRQDLLTLQMIELMDGVWKASGLDLHMIPYGCVATGDGIGMIEIVLSSDTIANITRKDGGAQAAFYEEPLMNWLRKYNRTPGDVEKCLWNFVYSLAGYCVATYILGIGDRHNDNIMMREDGTLFHIDFGHFLGNFKTKFGFKRETAPFIFTPMQAYMMGGSGSPIYAHFVAIACEAYNVIRRYSNMLIILFTLMLSTGIPELQSKDDIMWLKQVLLLDATDEAAARHYRQLIQEALTNRRTLINDYIHIIAH